MIQAFTPRANLTSISLADLEAKSMPIGGEERWYPKKNARVGLPLSPTIVSSRGRSITAPVLWCVIRIAVGASRPSAATQAKSGRGTRRGQRSPTGRAGSQLLRVDLVEFGVVEQQAAPLRQASDVAIVVLPADVVS
jgi:hypothetical protein